ncbi:hypothetical protein [Streptomyces lydicus]|uniref:hypothetical protein n=1 Tax=Streptomyces lydicus TaxID=47763 RepID=UPI0036ECE4A5
MDDTERRFGQGIDFTLGPAQPGLGKSLAVLRPVQLEALHSHRAHHEPIVSADARFDGKPVGLEIVALREALLTCVVSLPAKQAHTAAGGGKHVLTHLVGAKASPTQRSDIILQVLHERTAAVLPAVALVHLGEDADHVTNGCDFRHADDAAHAGGSRAPCDLLHVAQRQGSSGHRVRGGRKEAAPEPTRTSTCAARHRSDRAGGTVRCCLFPRHPGRPVRGPTA